MSLLSKVCMKMDFRGTTSVLVFLNCFVNDCFCLRNFFINEEYFIPGQESVDRPDFPLKSLFTGAMISQ